MLTAHSFGTIENLAYHCGTIVGLKAPEGFTTARTIVRG
jgi:hypothetical protein